MTEQSIKAQKQALRRQIVAQRQLVMDPETKSQRIREHLLAWLTAHPLKPGDAVALYAAIQGEVNLKPLVADLAARGLPCALPRTEPANRELAFHLVGPHDTLIAGTFGIFEPSVHSPLVTASQIGLFLVPGIAFTESGVRLGYGGGYYDRWFAGPAQSALRMGVAFGAQIVPHLPLEPHDQLMHYILSEEGIRACR